MFGSIKSDASRMRRRLHELTVKHGGIFFIPFWGVVVFGGLTLILHVCDEVFVTRKPLVLSLTVRIVIEKLLGGLMWGSIMWGVYGFTFRNAQKQDGSKDAKQ